MLIFLSAFFCHIVKLLKKVIRIGDTSCLLPIMDIFKDEDRKLMQTHCHFRALTILKSKQGDADIKEAIAYLSFAIIAAGRLIKILTAGLPLDPVLQLLGWTIIFANVSPKKWSWSRKTWELHGNASGMFQVKPCLYGNLPFILRKYYDSSIEICLWKWKKPC